MALFGRLRALLSPNRLIGDYASWTDAKRDSTGYDDPVILERVTNAAVKVKQGEAVYERDGVTFDTSEYSYPVLMGILWVTARHGGWLNILDFGGSLGSSFFQNHTFLKNLPEYQWNVIEQPSYVNLGKSLFQDAFLFFFPDIRSCLESVNNLNVCLCSSSLQYIEYPYTVLAEMAEIPTVKCIIIDRTPFWDGKDDRLCVQVVPPDIYPARYPSWIFSKEKFVHHLNTKGYTVLTEWENPDNLKAPIPFSYQGMIFVRKGWI